MDSFNARTVMAARIARECPAAMRPPGEPVAAAPRPVAGRAPGPGLGQASALVAAEGSRGVHSRGLRGLGPTAGYNGLDGLPRRSQCAGLGVRCRVGVAWDR